jgi:phenylacetate-coenzyme A ligase PaaK-like adenylate-forming protein
MATSAEPDFVGRMIVQQKVNVLLGSPSYLWNLFQQNDDVLAHYRGIKKVFYGGEHFTESQKKVLRERYGVQAIRSAAYGSNDTGPIGYQCSSCEGSIHHLHESLQSLEILMMDQDEPVQGEEPGRLVLSSKVRRGQSLLRYEIGDLGRWIDGACPCGRGSPRFELLGRYGDVFKAGGSFLNFRKFGKILETLPGYCGEYQIRITEDDLITLVFSNPTTLDSQKIRELCIEDYEDLREVVQIDRTARFSVEQAESNHLERTAGSAKLRAVIDLRKR